MITAKNTTVGFIGIGVMGSHMARHILNAGYPLHVHSRTRSKTQELCGKGAVWQNDIAQLAKKCQLIITMVGYPDDVESIYLNKDGILENAKSGSIAVDMTTSRPDLAATLHEMGQKKRIHCLDAPVTGGDIGAKNATLSIMVGGELEAFTQVLPILKLMGKNIHHQGPAGSGGIQHWQHSCHSGSRPVGYAVVWFVDADLCHEPPPSQSQGRALHPASCVPLLCHNRLFCRGSYFHTGRRLGLLPDRLGSGGRHSGSLVNI